MTTNSFLLGEISNEEIYLVGKGKGNDFKSICSFFRVSYVNQSPGQQNKVVAMGDRR